MAKKKMYRLAYIFWHILALLSISCWSSENTLSHIYCCSPSGCPSSNSMMKNSDRWLMKWKWGNKAITVQSVCICPSKTDHLADLILWKILIFIHPAAWFFLVECRSQSGTSRCAMDFQGDKNLEKDMSFEIDASWKNTRSVSVCRD